MKKTIIAIALGALLSGCASDRADPYARSAHSTYGNITVRAESGSTINFTIGDGALAAADGSGEISQPTTMTTTISPSLTLPSGGFDPVSLGINGIVALAGKGIDAYSAKHNTQAQQNSQGQGCANGECGDCPGGACSK